MGKDSMKLNKITNKDLKINIHHIGGIGNTGPTEILMGVNDFSHWTFYDADKSALSLMTDHKKKKFSLVNKCISNYDGQGEFHTMSTSSASSMFKPAESAKEYIRLRATTTWGEQTQIVKTEPIDVFKLDTLLKTGEIPRIDFLSIDAQGADLNIIKGTDLKHVMGVICEVEFSQLYEGQPLFHDVLKHMYDNDFRFCLLFNSQMMNVRRNIKSKGFLVVGEALFFKDPTKLINSLPDMDIVERTQTVVQIFKLCAIVSCFDQMDYTVDILERLQKQVSLKGIGYTKKLLDVYKEVTDYEEKVRESQKQFKEYTKWMKERKKE